MADLTPADGLQPSLLDRLTHQAAPALSMAKLRDCVRRDLSELLNTIHLAAVEDLDQYPEVARSTLNFGIPDLTGITGASINPAELERAIRQAIVDFEPRIVPASLKVEVVVRSHEMSRNALSFLIDGEMWAHPLPLAMRLESTIDLETGSAVVSDRPR